MNFTLAPEPILRASLRVLHVAALAEPAEPVERSFFDDGFSDGLAHGLWESSCRIRSYQLIYCGSKTKFAASCALETA